MQSDHATTHTSNTKTTIVVGQPTSIRIEIRSDKSSQPGPASLFTDGRSCREKLPAKSYPIYARHKAS